MNGSPTPAQTPPDPPAAVRGPEPGWKVLLALLCLLLSLTLWRSELVASLERPSVGDALSLRQLELAALVGEVIPPGWRPALVGAQPRIALRDELQRQVEADDPPAPALRRLELALLERAGDDPAAARRLAELQGMVDLPRRPLVQALITGNRLEGPSLQALLAPWQPPLMLRQLGCEQLLLPSGDADGTRCPAQAQPGRLLLKLLGVNGLPLLLLLVGTGLLLREAWRQWRIRPPAPPLVGPPFSPVEVTLLLAGGFVLLGEVLMPQLVQLPLQRGLAALALGDSLAQGLQVVGLYGGLMLAPLAILAALLAGAGPPPPGGWLQWHWRPVATALGQALATMLMVLPLVALAGWLIQRIWGDPGGSNPLLELVLTSADPGALICFGLTATVLAPLFEETLFRGVLLPVVGRRLGGTWAVLISASVFAVAHLSLGELVPLFLLGCGLGWLRWRSGRLAAPVLMHALWNGLTFLNLLFLAD